MKQNYFKAIGLCGLILTSSMNAQDIQTDFQKARKNEFSKLIGGIQEGGNLNYNSEKTYIEGSGGIEIKKSYLFLQGTGSIGTTTNLSTLFDQEVLPTYSGSLTIHFLFPKLSTWFYDGTFATNYAQLQNPIIDPSTINTGTSKFNYREELHDKVLKNSVRSADKIYTFKQLYWLSLSGKYDNSKYSFFDSTREFSDQIFNPVFDSWSGKFSLNGYIYWNKVDVKWNSWRPNFVFLNISAQYGLGNNISQLKKININDVTSSTMSNGTTREIVKSQSVYNGIYQEYNTFVPSIEFIFSPIRSFALTFSSDLNLINASDREKFNTDNYSSFSSGIYFYGDENSSKINIGAFYKWTKNHTTNEWVEQIGLKTSIPISAL